MRATSALLQLIQVFQSRQHHLLARLLDLSRQENLVQNGVDLVEIKDQVKLAHVTEERIKHLDKEMDSFQVRELVVVGVNAGAEK